MGMSTAVWQLLRRLPLPSASSKDVRHWSVDWRRLLLWRSLLLEMALLLLLLLLVSTGRAVNWSIRWESGRWLGELEMRRSYWNRVRRLMLMVLMVLLVVVLVVLLLLVQQCFG